MIIYLFDVCVERCLCVEVCVVMATTAFHHWMIASRACDEGVIIRGGGAEKRGAMSKYGMSTKKRSKGIADMVF